MDISLFDFDLPSDLVAQYPSERRDESRLMIVDRKSKSIKHSVFKNLPDELDSESLVILNNSRVIKCRLFGRRANGGQCEVFIHRVLSDKEGYAFLKPHKRFKVGERIHLEGDCEIEIVSKDEENVENLIKVTSSSTLYEIMEKAGHIPLPPYIKRADIKGIDDTRYQTIYAEKNGSIAAPTAGLHFTEDTFKRFKDKGILYDFITLYVGIGTFAPVRVKNILQHRMHSEEYEIPQRVAERINEFKSKGKSIVAVGTTTVRALESNWSVNGIIVPGVFSTDIFIYPSYNFKVVDAMITNFHLPKSTLFMLVCAFAGREFMLYAYNEAIKNRYRFFSYGDAMLIR
jgi:S-adenosylmethionine:tRNA ribosyltransferase-isomerase